MNTTKSTPELATQLLELHVQHELESLEAKPLMAWFEQESDPLFEGIKSIALNQFVTADQIKSTIQENVVEQEIPGAIAEIAGEASSKLFSSKTHLKTSLKQIMTAEQFESFLIKFLELEQQRNEVIDHVIDLPVYQELISGVVYRAITRYIYDSNVLSKNIPGVSSMLKMSRNVVNKTVPKLGGAVEDSVRKYISSNLGLIQQESKAFLIQTLSEDDLKASIMDFWDAIEDKTLEDMQSGMDTMDLSELVVLGYEFWLKFRKTEYFKHSYSIIVDYLFEKYGDMPLSELCEDLEITPQKLVKELNKFVPNIVAQLRDSGQLEAILRRRLESFYYSSDAVALMNGQ